MMPKKESRPHRNDCMTIQESFKKAVELLKTKEFIENPSLEARILICHVLKINEKEFILEKDRKKISDADWIKIKKLVEKRLKRTTIAHLINRKYFYDSEFYVNKDVLTPRPETELLIDIIRENWRKNDSIDILDIGTGSGNIVVSLAKFFINCRIDALDISSRALKIAGLNIARSNINKKMIRLIHKNILKFIPEKKYDIIVSNPPYIRKSTVKALLENRIICDPGIALDGGKDGLNFYRRLAIIADSCLKNSGVMYLEHGQGQRIEIMSLFDKGSYIIRTYDDLAGIDRAIAVKKRG